MILNARILAAIEGCDGDLMRGSEARNLISQDPIDENPMEARVARIESDIANIQKNLARIELDVGKLYSGQMAANDAIAKLNVAVATVDGRVNTLAVKLDALDAKIDNKCDALNAKIDDRFEALNDKIDAKVNALESKVIKWIIGTVLASASLAFSIAKFIH